MASKKYLKKTWEEFIYGGHLLSLGGSAIIYLIMLVLELKINLSLLFIMYLMPQIVYSLDHLEGAKKDAKTNPKRAEYFQAQKRKVIFLIFIYSIALLAILLYLKDWKISLAIFSILGLGAMYAGIFKNITKKIPAFKNIFVAFIWAFSPTILVALGYHLKFNLSLLLLFLFIFLRWIINTSFFDIKDLEADKHFSIKTLPVILGKNKTINFLQILNIISILPIIIGVRLALLPNFSLGLVAFYLYSFYYLEKAKKKETNINFLSYTLVDGEYIFWPILIFLIKF